MTNDEEEYVHFTHCIEDLNDAWQVLKKIQQRTELGSVEAAAFRYALVAYARPYTQSKGVSKDSHRLGDECVPSAHLELHRRLITARHQIHAHSDLTLRDAVIYVRKMQGRKIASQVRNCIDPLEEMSNLDEIVSLVELTLDCYALPQSFRPPNKRWQRPVRCAARR